MSTSVQWALISSLNHLETANSFGLPDQVNSIPSFTLLRAAIEHASLAIWLLDEDDQVVRRRNNLVFATSNFKEQEKLLRHLELPIKIEFPSRLEQINSIAERAGIGKISNKHVDELSITRRVETSGRLLVTCGIGNSQNNLTRSLYGHASMVAHSNAFTIFGLFSGTRAEDVGFGKALVTPLVEKSLLEYLEFVAMALVNLAVQIYSFRSGLTKEKYLKF